MFNDVADTIFRADALVFGSPSYFATMSGELKAFLERLCTVSLANDRLLADKVGAGISVERRACAVNVVDSIQRILHMSQMIVPGSTYLNIGIGRDMGDVASDTEAITNMEHLAKTIVWLVQAFQNTPRPIEF